MKLLEKQFPVKNSQLQHQQNTAINNINTLAVVALGPDEA